MAATTTISQGKSIPFELGDYVELGDYALPVEYPTVNYLEHPNDDLDIHSRSKRSPITPFKPVNPIIAKFTLGKSIPKALLKNPLICLFTLCKNKKFGLVL